MSILTRFSLLVTLPLMVTLRLAAVDFDVKNYGATGDGKTLDSPAINQAIAAAAAAGGGTVSFPAGTYASYSIQLKSHIVLHLEAGATLLAAEPTTDGSGAYDVPESNAWDHYQDFGHTHWHNSLIWGENLEDISITGPGRIYGQGLSRGTGTGRRDLLPEERRLPKEAQPNLAWPRNASSEAIQTGPFNYPNAKDSLPAGIGNKAIALKNCRNVILRDFTVYHGGHFAILATGVDNFTLDGLKIDTNRDGMDIDCCRNVQIANCSVNSPYDDGICLKSCFGLGYKRACENIAIANCHVSGYDEGTLLDGTCQRTAGKFSPTGRIKFGTEANGGFKNIAIANCTFDYCRGLALEEVDGGWMEDITVTNLTMRDIQNSAIYIRLGNRARGPDQPSVGVARRINLSNIVASNVDPRFSSIIAGTPGHPIEDLALSNIRILYRGGGTKEDAAIDPSDNEKDYPEPSRHGIMPAYGFFVRHVKGLSVHHLAVSVMQPDARPAFVLDDVVNADFDHIQAQRPADGPLIVLKNVTDFAVHNSRDLPETHRPEHIESDRL